MRFHGLDLAWLLFHEDFTRITQRFVIIANFFTPKLPPSEISPNTITEVRVLSKTILNSSRNPGKSALLWWPCGLVN